MRASTLLSKFFGRIDLIGDRFLRLHYRDLLDLADEDSAHPVLLEIESIAEVGDPSVDVPALERRNLPRHCAHGRDIDAVGTPAQPFRRLADQIASAREAVD
jgi:hypothetical protein